jgi:hypothetical protein
MLHKVPKAKTSVRQDLTLTNIILKEAINKNITPSFLWLFIGSKNTILYGRALEYQTRNPEEQLKVRTVDSHVDKVIKNMTAIKLCRLNDELDFQEDCPPLTIPYIRLTPFGRFFIKMPTAIQHFLYLPSVYAVYAAKSIIKYRWVASISSLLFGAVAWFQAHDISSAVVVAAGMFGLLVACILGWLSGFINE